VYGARNPYRDCLLLGAALALEVAGEEDAPAAAMARATHAIDSGAAGRVLGSLAAFSA
jgi:anthranilate phosphoribosyltransferase